MNPRTTRRLAAAGMAGAAALAWSATEVRGQHDRAVIGVSVQPLTLLGRRLRTRPGTLLEAAATSSRHRTDERDHRDNR